MEKIEIVELNGKKYELVLNRESFVRIDRICDVNATMYLGSKPTYEVLDEIPEDYNPMEDMSMDKVFETETKRLNGLKKLISMTLFVLMYPKNKLTPKEVQEIVETYFEDDKKIEEISTKVGELLQQCIEMKDEAIREFEEKNLKAQTKK